MAVLAILIFLVLLPSVGLLVYWRYGNHYSNQNGTLNIPGSNYEYRYVLGATESSLLSNGITVRLPVFLPNVIVDSHRNDSFGQSLVFAADESQRLELEGDFYKNCAVYVPKGYERVALQLLTPDVMQLLQAEADTFDVEIIGSTLNVLCRRNPNRDTELARRLIEVATVLVQKSQSLMKNWIVDNNSDHAAMVLRGYQQQMIKVGPHHISNKLVLAMMSLLVVLFIALQLLGLLG